MKVGKKRPRAPDSGADTSDARHHNAKRPRLLPERWDGVWFHECPLCDCIIKRGRHKTIHFADVHHLRPKSEHKRLIAAGICDFEECNGETALVILCRLCHSAIHDFWTNAQLADLLYTVKRLRYLLDKIGWQSIRESAQIKSAASIKQVIYKGRDRMRAHLAKFSSLAAALNVPEPKTQAAQVHRKDKQHANPRPSHSSASTSASKPKTDSIVAFQASLSPDQLIFFRKLMNSQMALEAELLDLKGANGRSTTLPSTRGVAVPPVSTSPRASRAAKRSGEKVSRAVQAKHPAVIELSSDEEDEHPRSYATNDDRPRLGGIVIDIDDSSDEEEDEQEPPARKMLMSRRRRYDSSDVEDIVHVRARA